LKSEKKKNNEFARRVLGIILGVPPFVVLLLLNQWTLIGIFVVLSLLSFREYWKMMSREQSSFALWFSAYPLVLIYSSLFFTNPLIQVLGGYIFLIVLMIWSLFHPSQVLERSGIYLWGCVYCFLFPFFWVKAGIEHPRLFLLFFVLLVWTNDIFAYLVGTRWGYHKIVPALSPKKSWEGLAGGVSMTIALSMLLGNLWLGLSLWKTLLAGCTIALLSFVGDVFESALKRKIGIKDSGKFLPGHGGVLDRFDSFFAVGPLVYLLSKLFWKG